MHVVRLAPGEAVTLFNGDGGEYTAALRTMEKRRASAEIKAHTAREPSCPTR